MSRRPRRFARYMCGALLLTSTLAPASAIATTQTQLHIYWNTATVTIEPANGSPELSLPFWTESNEAAFHSLMLHTAALDSDGPWIVGLRKRNLSSGPPHVEVEVSTSLTSNAWNRVELPEPVRSNVSGEWAVFIRHASASAIPRVLGMQREGWGTKREDHAPGGVELDSVQVDGAPVFPSLVLFASGVPGFDRQSVRLRRHRSGDLDHGHRGVRRDRQRDRRGMSA